MTKKADLSGLLAKTAGSTRKHSPQPAHASIHKTGRLGTVPITVHYPKTVRDQLKILAVKNDKTMHELVGEALNDLFAKNNMPEIAPTESAK
jgi:hypothetical protein